MKIKIDELKKVSHEALQKIGFSKKDCEVILDHLITAELSGKKSHGVVRIPRLKKQVASGKIRVIEQDPDIIKETPISLHINGKYKTALVVLNWSLERAIPKAINNMICLIGTKDVAPVSGMIGYFARKAVSKNLILIGFNNSPAGLTPYGSKESLWGTNPFTVGIPTDNPELPIILDMASSKMTFGDVMIHAALNKSLPEDVSLDKSGNPTTDPKMALEGSQMPFEGRKGSGLAFIVEILGGILVGSKGGNSIPGGEWGSFFILINPELYKPIDQFKKEIKSMIEELKNTKKQDGISEIFYPGEKSGKTYLNNLKLGEVEISEEVLNQIKNI